MNSTFLQSPSQHISTAEQDTLQFSTINPLCWSNFIVKGNNECHFYQMDSGLSDEEQERKGPKNRPKHTRKTDTSSQEKLFGEIQNSLIVRITGYNRKTKIYFIGDLIYTATAYEDILHRQSKYYCVFHVTAPTIFP